MQGDLWFCRKLFDERLKFATEPQKTRQALGWKSIDGARASLHGRELWTMLKREQIEVAGDSVWERFYALAG